MQVYWLQRKKGHPLLCFHLIALSLHGLKDLFTMHAYHPPMFQSAYCQAAIPRIFLKNLLPVNVIQCVTLKNLCSSLWAKLWRENDIYMWIIEIPDGFMSIQNLILTSFGSYTSEHRQSHLGISFHMGLSTFTKFQTFTIAHACIKSQD